MARASIPLIVLAGGDPDPGTLPEGAENHPLAGGKGMDLRLGDRPLIDHLLERLRDCGGFDPIFIAGPRRVYGAQRQGAEVIDTDGTFAENIRMATRVVGDRAPGEPLAYITCDVLPEVEELRVLLDDYRAHAPLDFWFPVVVAPERKEELGASAWKPQYRIMPRDGGEPRRVLPGHLLIADPWVNYQDLTNACFELAYRSRNRKIVYRLGLMIRSVLFLLLRQDLQRLRRLRPPVRTVTALSNGIRLALRLRDGVIRQDELEERLSRIYIHRRHRRRHPDRQGRMALFETLSLAKDIDTREEAEERQRTLLEET